MEKMRMESVDMTAQNIDRIAALFPNCITETKDENGHLKKVINFEMLRQMLSGEVLEGDETYEFTWVGKKAAIIEANKPIRKTLRPCPEESVDWDNTENLYIEGDNLEVLKLLQESYLGKVKMIYIDPPYNTGNDFVYADDFHMSNEDWDAESGAVNDEGIRLFRNTSSNGRFHSDWCSMIYSRLMLARNLLTADGVIFISIDDNEQENLRKICDEVFGEANFIGKIAVVNNLKGRNDRKDIATCHEYMMIYGKSEFTAGGMPLTEEQRSKFDKIDENGNAYQLRDLRKRGRPDRREDRPNMYFPIYYNEATKECSLEKHEGWVEIFPLRGDGSDGRWRWGRERVQANLSILEPRFSNIAGRWGIQHRVYLNPALNPANAVDGEDDEENTEERAAKSKSFWMGGELSSDVGRRQIKKLFGTAYFDYPKSVDLILNTLYMGTDPDSIVMDFFSGSATTAHAVMQMNATDSGKRKFIMVQLPETIDPKSDAYKAGYRTICDIGKERIRLAGKAIKNENPLTTQNLDTGFRVLKVDDSNMTDVFYSAGDYTQNMLSLLESNIKADRSALDLFFGCLLEWGLPLSMPFKSEEIEGFMIYTYNEGDLIACFDEDIPDSVIKAIAKRQPLRAVFRDNSFKSSPSKINVGEIFKMLAPDTKVKVI